MQEDLLVISSFSFQKAAMSMAPLSINAEREDAIDFTSPFKSRGITVLMKTPEHQTWYFQFMAPLSNEVWFATLGAFMIISFLLFLLERYSRRFGRSVIRLDASESYWFIFGALVSGSSESTPATLPGRILTRCLTKCWVDISSLEFHHESSTCAIR